MTAVAAVLVAGKPALVGDVVLTLDGKRVSYAGKIYVAARNVAIGWSGNVSLAKPAITRLRQELSGRGRRASVDDLERALKKLEDLRDRPGETLDLTGWIVTPAGPKVIRWASYFNPTMLGEGENSIGDGGYELRGMLAEAEIGKGNSEGHDVAPMKTLSGFIAARFEEMLRDDWPQTWGAAFDALVYQADYFRWLDKLTYIGWNVVLDRDDRISDITQAPEVFTQERVHRCTVMWTKRVGAADHDVNVSRPIHCDDIEPDWYARRPYSVVSPYYANYFLVRCRDNYLAKMSLVAENATPAGVMCHAGANETDPSFQVNRSVLEPMLREMLDRTRAKHAVRQSSSPA